MNFLPDHYELHARLRPALLVVLPVGLAVAAWFPDRFLGWGLLVGIATSCGLTGLLAQFGRDLGKKKEQGLHEGWGGKPTTQLLRHGNSQIDPHTKTRYKVRLQSLITGLVLPTAKEEVQRPDEADEMYASCTKYLLEQTRDRKRFDLIYSENVNYGFRRNIWGMKPSAILLSCIGLLAAAVPIYLHQNDSIPPIAVAATVLNLALLVWWVLRITKGWVRTAAFAYAERLLAACELL